MKLKIVNISKFIKSTLFILLFIIGLSLLITKTSFSHSEVNYKTVPVIQGDTLWTIAAQEQKYNEYYLNKDIRYIIEDIKKINFKDSSNLIDGDVLQIPIFK